MADTSSSPLTRVGFVGCGNHATHNLYPSLRFADCELVAVCDLYDVNRERNQRVFGAKHAHSGYDEMLEAHELDAVFVCGPAKLHYEAALAALRKGLHVFIEKPPAPTLEQTRELAQAAKEAGKICAVGFMKRFGSRYREAFEIASKPDFGRKTHFYLRYSYGAGGDPQSIHRTMCTHGLDLARHFMGDVETVQVIRPSLDGTVNLSLQLRFKNGGTGTVVMNNQSPGVFERMELTGEGAMVVVDEVARLEHYPKQSENQWKPPHAQVKAPNMALQVFENYSLELQGYVGEVQQFIDAAAGKAPLQWGTIEDGVKAMELVEVLDQGKDGEFQL